MEATRPRLVQSNSFSASLRFQDNPQLSILLNASSNVHPGSERLILDCASCVLGRALPNATSRNRQLSVQLNVAGTDYRCTSRLIASQHLTTLNHSPPAIRTLGVSKLGGSAAAGGLRSRVVLDLSFEQFSLIQSAASTGKPQSAAAHLEHSA